MSRTMKDRVIAYKVNTSDYPWDIYPTYKQDKEDALAVRDYIIHLENTIAQSKAKISEEIKKMERQGLYYKDHAEALQTALNIITGLESKMPCDEEYRHSMTDDMGLKGVI